MKLITEQNLREEIGGKELERYSVEPGTLVTPSARQYLADRKIELVTEKPDPLPMPNAKAPEPADEGFRPRFVGPDGGTFEVKPEHLTHLRGNLLVTKGHPRIALRGKFDSLQADILELQALALDANDEALVAELDEVTEFVRRVLAAEVRDDEPFEDQNLLGLTLDELRAMSHRPKEFFGLGHIRPHHTMGKCCIGLNKLRTRVRELELAAFKAFELPGGVERPDLIKALNRLSSTVYVLMYRHLPKGYDKCY